jgi:hypothetical protein
MTPDWSADRQGCSQSGLRTLMAGGPRTLTAAARKAKTSAPPQHLAPAPDLPSPSRIRANSNKRRKLMRQSKQGRRLAGSAVQGHGGIYSVMENHNGWHLTRVATDNQR